MEYLSKLILSFDSAEREILLKFYQEKDGLNKNQNDIYLIIKTVIEEGAMTDNELSDFLSWKKNNAFYKKKKLLRKELLSHILYLNPVSINLSGSCFNAEIECDKLIIVIKILLKKSFFPEAKKILDYASKIAISYDLQLQQLVINDLLKMHRGATQGWKKVKQFGSKIDLNFKSIKALFKAKDLWQFIDLNQAFNSNQKENFSKESSVALKELKKIYFKSKLPNIGYYYYLAASTVHRIRKDYSGAIKYSLKLIGLLKKHKAIHSYIRMAIANSHLAMAYLNLFDFNQAYQYCRDSIKFFTKNSLNELRGMEIYFPALLNTHRLNDANYLIKKALRHPQIHTSKHTDSLWMYFEAVLLFKQGKPMKSFKKLSKLNKILMDKYGWFMGSKILELMCCIESKNINLYLYRIESLDKTLERRGREKKIKKRSNQSQNDGKQNLQRIKLIYGICKNLVENCFNFEATLKVCQNEMKLLSDGKDMYHWNPIGYELIRFDTWFLSKIKPKRLKPKPN